MEHPVYRFGAVLRRLRNDAGLSILAAAEATGYGKYERWESGQTRVGGQYLASIAEVFGVADDLHLLVYAWLLDRLTPVSGEARRQVDLDELRCHPQGVPDTRIDLGEDANLVLEPGRHVDVALLLLTARYREHGALVLQPADREPLPASEAGRPALLQLYGDTFDAADRLVGRQLLARGLDDGDAAVDIANIAPLLATPATYERLADGLDTIDARAARPTVAFAASTAPDARRFAELLPILRSQLRDLLDAAGRPTSDAEVERLTQQVLARKKLPFLRVLFRAAVRRRLPLVDPAVAAELQATLDRLRRGWHNAVVDEAVVELRQAGTADVFDALDALRGRRTA